uniref:Uncharacterized protein n=1 Tax=Caenorhabditis japonica TaxID=281687 RepID=A0A8R1ENG4_CAEJA
MRSNRVSAPECPSIRAPCLSQLAYFFAQMELRLARAVAAPCKKPCQRKHSHVLCTIFGQPRKEGPKTPNK